MAELRRGERSGLEDVELAWQGAPFGDRLVELVLAGPKRASCSLLAQWEAERRPLPEAGSRWALIDCAGRERGVIEVTEVRLLAIAEIDDDFARSEGEADQNVAQWRAGHEAFWAGELPELEITDQTIVVAERFDLVERFEDER